MKKLKKNFTTVDEYIAGFNPEIQTILEDLRAVIKKAAPGASEKISYQMPAFVFKGVLVYFAAYDHHIGFYPTASGIENFKNELSDFETSRGTIRFPLDKPIPFDLVAGIVKFRIKENETKTKKIKH